MLASSAVNRAGYTLVGRVRRIPVLVHWSMLLGMLFFGGTHPGGWVGFIVIILVHELGHAAVCRHLGLRVHRVEMHGFGGACTHEATDDALDESLIAWGGVWAQLLLMAGVLTCVGLFSTGPFPSVSSLVFGVPWMPGFWGELCVSLIAQNLRVALFNLLPVPGFDGLNAWRLPGLLVQPHKRRRRAKRGRTKGARSKRRPGPAPSHLRLVRDPDGDFRFETDPKDPHH